MNSSSSLMDSAISVSEPLPPSVLFFVSNVHHLIPIKLNEHNYPIWKIQCEGALKASSLFDFIQQSQAQSPTITDSNGNSIPNPNYFSWFVIESYLRSCLISTLSPAIFAEVTHTRTALELCELLKQKFEKPTNSSEQNSGELASGNQSRRIAPPQPVSPAICQICANRGHIAAHCSYRSVMSFRSDRAPHSTSNATKVFDGSPNSELFPITDGSNVSADTNATGTRRLLESDMEVLNQCESRFINDRLALPFQQKNGPHIFGVQKKVNSTANQEMSRSGSKQTAPAPHCSTDLSSDPLNKNEMALFCMPSQVSRLWAGKQDTGMNNENGGSSKETGNAVELTQSQSTNIQKILNSEDAGLEGKSLPVYKKVNGGNTLVLMSTTDNKKRQVSEGTNFEGNPLQVNKTLNVANVIESKGTTDDQTIQNTPKRKLEGESLQVNKKLNGGNTIRVTGTTDSEKIQNPVQRKPEGKSPEVYRQLNGGNANIEIKRTADEQKILKTQESKLEGNSLEGKKMLDGDKAMELTRTADFQEIKNSRKRKFEENPLQVMKKSDGGFGIELTGTDDYQKSPESLEKRQERISLVVNSILSGRKSMELTGIAADQTVQNPQERRSELNVLQANKKLNGGNAIELTGTADYQKIQNSQERKLEGNSMKANKVSIGGKATDHMETTPVQKKIHSPQEGKLEGIPLEIKKKVNSCFAIGRVETADHQKIQNSQERKLEGNSSNSSNATELAGTTANQNIQVMKLSGGNAVEHTGSAGHQKIQNSQEMKILNGGEAIEPTRTAPDQKIENPGEKKLGENTLQGIEKLNGGNAIELTTTADYEKTANSQERKVEGNTLPPNEMVTGSAEDQKLEDSPLQVNKMLNGTVDDQKKQTSQTTKLEDAMQSNNLMLWCDLCKVGCQNQKSWAEHCKGKRHKRHERQLQNSQERKLEGNSVEANKLLSGGKDTDLTVTAPDEKKIHNPLEENPLESNKKLNSCSTIDLVETADHQKIQNSTEMKLEGNLLNSSDATELAGTTDTRSIQVCRREKWKKVIEKLSGGNAVELTGTGDHQKIQNSPEKKVEENKTEASKILSGGEAMDLTGTAPDQKIENPPEKKLGENTLQGNEKANLDYEKIEIEGKSLPPNETVTGSVDDQKTWNPEEQKLEERSSLQGNEMLDGAIDDQKKQNPQTTEVEDNKNLSGGDAKQSSYFMFWCDLCKVGNHNEKTWTEHLNGKKHRKQLQKHNQIAAFGGVSGDLKEGLKMVNEPEVAAKEGSTGEALGNNSVRSADENCPENVIDGSMNRKEDEEIVDNSQPEKERDAEVVGDLHLHRF